MLRPGRLLIAFAAALALTGGAVAGAQTAPHTVERGETLSGIAARAGTTVRALAEANGIANPNRIVAGQVLLLPSATAGAAPAVVHVVRPGETLSGIAARYGTTSRALAAANGITNPNLVVAGARLGIPGAAAPAAAPAPAPPVATHVVLPGETLSGIAARYGVTTSALAAANAITNVNRVYAGQQLALPGGGVVGGDAAGRTGVAGTHRVQRGETLSGIAARNGISAGDLATANGLVPPYTVLAGSRLQLDSRSAQPGGLAQCPVPGARFANDWGMPRSGGRAHEGNDLFAPRGTPVLAPVAGVVSFGQGAIGGNQLRMVGDDGNLYFGSHLEGFGTGGRVAPGAVIGYVGTSGNAAGGSPHLHFEIHPGGGAAMNPVPVLQAVC